MIFNSIVKLDYCLVFLIIGLYLLCSSCCKRLYQFPSISKISTDVVVGIGEVPTGVILSYSTFNIWETHQIKKFEKIPVFFQGVKLNIYCKNKKFIPAEKVEVVLSVVDEFGDATDKGYLSISKLDSDSTGFNRESIFFSAKEVGVYRVKAEYKDNNADAFSYSSIIMVVK